MPAGGNASPTDFPGAECGDSVTLAQFAQFSFILATAVGVFSFVRTAEDGEARRACTALCQVSPNYAARDRLAPHFALDRLGGGRVRLSDYRGKTVVLNFWTKACQPCLEEMPSLAALATTLRARGDGLVLTVNTDTSADDARSALKAALGGDAPFDVLLDPDSRVVAGQFGTKLYPETWFIDAEGVIRARVDGARDYSQPLWLDFIDGLSSGPTCDVEFLRGRPRGPEAALCTDVRAL